MWSCPPRSILAPVDFGPASARAVQVAGLLANRFSARLTVLHAETIEAPPYFTHDQLADIERQRVAARAQARAYLASFAGRLTSLEAEIVIADGPAPAAILSAARSYDLVVMGTQGHRGAKRWWLGSVAEQVVRSAPAPVLVVREDTEEIALARLFEQLEVLTEGSEDDRRTAERYARALAGSFDGAVAVGRRRADCLLAGSSLVVVPSLDGPGQGWLSGPIEDLIRSCRHPVLFVRGQPLPAGVGTEVTS